jgi:ABC-type Fe3+-hydroxamate transport system substrate-binding protein
MKLRGLILVLVVLSIVVLVGCQAETPIGNYTDDLGRTVQIKGAPQRIISLAPSNTEMVYALGLEDRLIGVTTYCNYPEAVKDKPKVSEYSNVDIEKIVSLQPDLVLADSIHKATVIPALEKLNIPVLAVIPENLEKILSLLGKLAANRKPPTSWLPACKRVSIWLKGKLKI